MPKIYINVNIYIDNIMKLTYFLIDLILKYIYGYILVVLYWGVRNLNCVVISLLVGISLLKFKIQIKKKDAKKKKKTCFC